MALAGTSVHRPFIRAHGPLVGKEDRDRPDPGMLDSQTKLVVDVSEVKGPAALGSPSPRP